MGSRTNAKNRGRASPFLTFPIRVSTKILPILAHLGDCILRRIGAYSKKRVNNHVIRGAVMATISNERDIRRIGNNHNDDRLPARLLAVGEVAHFLGVHTSTVRRWEKKGLLRSYAIGLRNSLRFKQEDVLSFLNKSRKKSIGAA